MNQIKSQEPACPGNTLLIEWGIAAQSFDGTSESGDQCLIESFPNGALVSVVDALGHGPKAAAVAKIAIGAIKGHAHRPVSAVLQHCHEKLKRTRGVVMSLVSFDAVHETMSWLGIGNVQGIVLHADAGMTCQSLTTRSGVVGYHLPTLRPATLPIEQGDVLVLVTDGIRSDFIREQTQGTSVWSTDTQANPPLLVRSASPQEIADHVLVHYGRGTDDTFVLVVRYLGNAPKSELSPL